MNATDGVSRRTAWCVAAIVAIGLSVRLAHLMIDPPVWHDEAAAILNVLDKSYAELWGPRLVNATEPPLTLSIFKASVQTFGDGVFAFRGPSFVAGCLAFVLAVFWFRKTLPPREWIAFTAMFALSDRLIFHSIEAKTYSFDLLVAVIFLRWVVVDESPLTARLVRATLISPLVFLSYPLVFMMAAFGIVESARWARGPDRRTAAALVLFAVVSGGCSIGLLLGPIRAIQTASVEQIWATEFPNYAQPALLPIQLAGKILDTFRYAHAPIGQALALFAVVGGVVLTRQGRSPVVAWFLTVFAINAAAWFAGKYPLGHYRVTTYLLPAIFWLSAHGIVATFDMLTNRVPAKTALASLLVIIPIGQTAYRFAVPWTRLDSRTPTQYILERRQADEPVAAHLWEQWYYLRSIKPMLREGPPTVNDPSVACFWYLGNLRDSPDALLPAFTSSGQWRITDRTDFAHFAALRFQRSSNGPAVEGTPVRRTVD